MNRRLCFTLNLLVLTLASLACGLLSLPPTAQVTSAPSLSSADTPDLPPSTQPSLAPAVDLPSGIATARDNMLSVYDLNGVQTSQVDLPQHTYLGTDRVHLAGTMPGSSAAAPLIYFSFDNTEALLYRDSAGQIFNIQDGAGLLGLTGVPGQPIVAYSQIEYLDMALRSKLFVGSIQTLPSAAPVNVVDDPESWAVKPILLEAENGTPVKVWYTRIAYGIGGDIVFEPRKGLFVYMIATGQTNPVLDNTVAPWDISKDKNWFAYSFNEAQENSMCIKNVQTRAELCYPALPAGEPRGAGNAHFSPDSQYIAWMEGDGWQMAEVPSFKSTVRVGQNNGNMIVNLPMAGFEAAAGIGLISRAEPVAWLDNQTVVVQVRGQEWDQVALVRFNVVNQDAKYLAPGEYVGLLYP